jgi:hypothetical protein
MFPVQIECDFRVDIDNYYTCFVKNLNVVTSSVVTGIIGNHTAGKSCLDVEHIYVYLQNVASMPKGIENFFPSIKKYWVERSNLQSFSNSDIQHFPALLQLLIKWHPAITSLPGDLLIYTPSITRLNFFGDKIAKVGASFFDPLTNLQSADFSQNVCIDQAVYNKPVALAALEQAVITNCA